MVNLYEVTEIVQLFKDAWKAIDKNADGVEAYKDYRASTDRRIEDLEARVKALE